MSILFTHIKKCYNQILGILNTWLMNYLRLKLNKLGNRNSYTGNLLEKFHECVKSNAPHTPNSILI